MYDIILIDMASYMINTIFRNLERRRRDLGMTYGAVAVRSGVSLPTVQRILSGDHPNPTFANVNAIARALDMTLGSEPQSPADILRERQAAKRARELVGLVQATSALEGQALDADSVERMVRQTIHELLAGSPRKLWAEE
jgi:transcriptional regulator with XRE-family HTH domain